MLTTFLKRIADAIRLKTGETELINAQDFETKIISMVLPGVAELVSGTIETVDLSNATALSQYSLYNCPNIKSVILPRGITKIPEYFLGFGSGYSNYNMELNLDIPENVTLIENYAFYRREFNNLYVPLATYGKLNASIRANNIFVKGNLTEYLNRDDNDTAFVSSSGYYFQDENGEYYLLENLVIPEGITQLNKYLFSYIRSLKNVIFPSTLTTIKDYCFSNCSNVRLWNIPESVTTLGKNVFINSRDQTFIFNSQTPPTIANTSVFSTANLKILVPNGCGNAYKTATNWTSYANYIFEINSTLTLNVANEFLNNDNFTYSLDNGKTWQKFDNATITLEYVSSIKFRSLSNDVLMKITGTTEIGTIANAVTETYVVNGSETITISVDE